VEEEFDLTIAIMETRPGPPAGRPRWYCYQHQPGFDTPEEGVEWALTQTDLVLVRPLNGPYYWAGTEPQEWPEDEWPLKPWPPSSQQRRQIDADYQRVIERLAEVKRIAPRLAVAIADRVGQVAPEPWSIIASSDEGAAVTILRNGREALTIPIADFEMEELYAEVLGGLQDDIAEETTDAWPHDPARGMHLWMPEVEVGDHEIRAWFGPKADPVLVLDPIDLAELRR
jgi:hypothetical protein